MADPAQDPPPWRPLSVREGRIEDAGPFEGIPAHLEQAIDEWLVDTMEAKVYGEPETVAEYIALRLQVSGERGYSRLTWLRNAARSDPDKGLDVVDAALLFTRGKTADALDRSLMLGGSVWQVNEQKNGLDRRVNAGEQNAYEAAVAPTDGASDQLRIAWAKVYGRHPDFSDAWDHAIKACEALLAPIVTPNAATPTLGSIISTMEAKPTGSGA